MMQEHEAELAQIGADKIKSKYSSMAAAKAAAAKAKGHGLFGAIGDAISGTFDRVFKVADVAGLPIKWGFNSITKKLIFDNLFVLKTN